MSLSTGVLVHSRNLQTKNWATLQWGVPSENRLGTLTKLVELLLDESAEAPITMILFDVGLTADGIPECEYTKKFLLDNFDRLDEFARFKTHPRFQTKADRALLRQRLEKIVLKRLAVNTTQEVTFAAEIFEAASIRRVIQLTAVNHGPRCLQQQARARANGLIPSHQQWFMVLDDMCFDGATPEDTVVIEPPHRSDDPLLGFHPAPQEIMRRYIALKPADKQHFLETAKEILDSYADTGDYTHIASLSVSERK